MTSDLVSDIILQPSFNVRTLSIREVQNLNERKLQQALIYAVRPSRVENTPKLQALYIFGTKDSNYPPRLRQHASSLVGAAAGTGNSRGVVHTQGAQIGAEWNQSYADTHANMLEKGDHWYQGVGKVFTKPPSLEWANTMQACQGLISFDAVLCGGLRHSILVAESTPTNNIPWYQRPGAHIQPRVAICAVGGCHRCGSAPEGFSQFGTSSISQFPLLSPPPLHCSTSKAAKIPFIQFPETSFLARCTDCLRNRYCESCHIWWCEDCYEIPNHPSYGGGEVAKGGAVDQKVKVHMGFCVENCLVKEMEIGAGSNGMWG